jgi:hypothetical protein
VVVHGTQADRQTFGDVGVAPAVGQQHEHLVLASSDQRRGPRRGRSGQPGQVTHTQGAQPLGDPARQRHSPQASADVEPPAQRGLLVGLGQRLRPVIGHPQRLPAVGGGTPVPRSLRRERPGALDLDVHPGRTQPPAHLGLLPARHLVGPKPLRGLHEWVDHV